MEGPFTLALVAACSIDKEAGKNELATFKAKVQEAGDIGASVVLNSVEEQNTEAEAALKMEPILRSFEAILGGKGNGSTLYAEGAIWVAHRILQKAAIDNIPASAGMALSRKLVPWMKRLLINNKSNTKLQKQMRILMKAWTKSKPQWMSERQVEEEFTEEQLAKDAAAWAAEEQSLKSMAHAQQAASQRAKTKAAIASPLQSQAAKKTSRFFGTMEPEKKTEVAAPSAKKAAQEPSPRQKRKAPVSQRQLNFPKRLASSSDSLQKATSKDSQGDSAAEGREKVFVVTNASTGEVQGLPESSSLKGQTKLEFKEKETQQMASVATAKANPAIPELWKVCGDCRCLFRAVCRARDDPNNKIDRNIRGEPLNERAKLREQTRADELRTQVCDRMKVRIAEVASFLGSTVEAADSYIQKMRKWTTWGDAICLHFLPDLVGAPIQVYALNLAKKQVFETGIHLPQQEASQDQPVIVLWYDGHSHYDLVSRSWLVLREKELITDFPSAFLPTMQIDVDGDEDISFVVTAGPARQGPASAVGSQAA
eukprot:TRINITY_DN26738_c0_g1_i1.p1 TRINITY_DN26738_c0_g1~~TRINITY_DN26738_c0_g1_i1.p1  ORF type:complete len:564 (-),score=162.57 TRINITY_DN26738_c0_g1_i1:630-2249(-)